MKKLVLVLALLLAVSASASAAVAWDLGLPAGGIEVNFNGDGVFDQVPDPIIGPDFFPEALAVGTELFGISNVTSVDKVGTGDILWTPVPGTEMTLSFFDAVATASATVYEDANIIIITSTFADGARVVICQDDSADYDSTGGPGLFNLATGTYPTVYENGGDADELVFLDLLLNTNTSTLTWSKAGGAPGTFLSATFDALDVTILGGVGASQFSNAVKGHGGVLTLNLLPGDWLYNADTDMILTTVPAPAALFSLVSGLALLGGGYRLRRKA